MKLEQLNHQHGVDQSIWFCESQDHFIMMHLNAEFGNCRISLYGGQVLDCQIEGREDLTWLSPDAIFRPGKAIRGGIPLVFPWFGDHPNNPALPAHGFARISVWNVLETECTEHSVSVVLELRANPDTRGFWDHDFVAKQRITLSADGLSQSLELSNTGDTEWSWAGGFHPYFHISNLDSLSVKGLDYVPYLNLPDGVATPGEQNLRFGPEIDRAYHTEGGELSLVDSSLGREMVLQCNGADSVVLWNPGRGKAKSDMPVDGPEQFVCLEPARAATVREWDKRSLLAPGESTKISFRVHFPGGRAQSASN